MPRQLPILVTTDLQQDAASSRRSRAVNRQALALAKRLGAPVELVHVAQVDALTLVPQAMEILLDSRKEGLRNLAAKLPGVTGARLLAGHPVSAITGLAARRGRHELLVQGTSGRTGLGRAFLGSVAEEVLRAARIPVMTVGPRAQSPKAATQLESTASPLILLATGLDPTSAPAEKLALRLAKQTGGRVHAVHHLQAGMHPLLQTAMSTPSGSRELQDLLRGLRRDAEKQLTKLAATFKAARVPFHSTIVQEGLHASEGILSEAKKRDAALIVMGTHARSLLVGGFLGSTARAVILGASAPVITTHR